MKAVHLDEYPKDALKKLQETEIQILQAIEKVCDELNVTWFVNSGTAIGAVRHKGFIPWDDDIDIGIPYDDYKVFMEKAEEVMPEGFGVYYPAKTKNYSALWMKVYKKGTKFISDYNYDAGFESGIFVDVFPFVQLDSNQKTADQQVRSLANWQRFSYLYHSSKLKQPKGAAARIAAKIAFTLGHGVARVVYSPKALIKCFDETCESGDHQGLWVNGSYPLSGRYTTESFFPTCMLPFEEMSVPVPHDVHGYLTQVYGDYMQLPPKDKQKNHPVRILDFGDGINVLEA